MGHRSMPVELVLNWCLMESKLLAVDPDAIWHSFAADVERNADPLAQTKMKQIACVLSHRRDKISNEFLRKHAERGRGEAKGGAAGLRMTMGTAQMMYATSSL